MLLKSTFGHLNGIPQLFHVYFLSVGFQSHHSGMCDGLFSFLEEKSDQNVSGIRNSHIGDAKAFLFQLRHPQVSCSDRLYFNIVNQKENKREEIQISDQHQMNATYFMFNLTLHYHLNK